MAVLGHFNYWVVMVLMMAGFYTVVARGNLVKKLVGLNIFQTSVFLFYISVGKVAGGTAPIVGGGAEVYSNPLPHVLILTAIVVGVATTALALALIVRIREAYGSVEEGRNHPPGRRTVIVDHLPILQVAVPLVGAPLCVLSRRGALAWPLATLASWTAFAIALWLLARVLETGVISYELGGWAVPWGIEYRVDPVDAFVLVVVAGIAAVTMPFARASVGAEIAAAQHHLFYCVYLLALAGLLGVTITGDAFNLFVFLEIASLSAYVLVGMGQDRRALAAAFRYLIMGTIGATFILIGIGFLYMMTGTLNIADLAERVAPVADTRTVRAAFAFLTVGIAIKIALFPLHLWLPNAYAYAPSAVAVLLAGTATKVAVYVLLRFTFTLFGADFAFETMALGAILLPLALAAALGASLVALFQNDVKRLLAYSSLAQIGYIVAGISLASTTGPDRGDRPSVQPRGHESCVVHVPWRGRTARERRKPRRLARARPPHAAHHVGVRGRRSQPHRRALHRRIREQVDTRGGGPGGRRVAGSGGRPTELARRPRIRLAGRRGGLLPPPRRG